MKQRGFGVLVTLLITACRCVRADGATEKSPLRLTLVVCDGIGLDQTTRLTAKREVTRIFERAGVTVDWIEAARNLDAKMAAPVSPSQCVLPSLKTYFLIVVSAESPKNWTSPDAMGFAPSQSGPQPRAYVFYDLLNYYLSRFNLWGKDPSIPGVILGCAMAHELGHLIIPGDAHGRGIMHSPWTYQEWQRALEGGLLFTRDHAVLIRKRLQITINDNGH